MVRLACVDVRQLALQLLLARHPEWKAYPAAVVSRDSPGGTILSLNARAGNEGVTPGLRYAAGLSCTPELRAGVVPQREIDEGLRRILRRLHNLSPQVEPCSEPGLFWLDAAGLVPLYRSLEHWAGRVQSELGEEGFVAAVAVGFCRFGCYAGAKTLVASGASGAAPAVPPKAALSTLANLRKVFVSPEQERAAALSAPLVILFLDPPVSERLEMLGVRSVGEFLALPAGAVRRRFGAEAERRHRFAAGVLAAGAPELPLQPQAPEQELSFTVPLPAPSSETLYLLQAAAQALDSLLQAAEARRDMVRELRLRLKTEGREVVSQRIVPAVPTRDRRLLLELITLRLDSGRLPGVAVSVILEGACTRETLAQRELFVQPSIQAREAAAQAFARLRAVFGNEVVQRACLEDEHLPERSFRWENLEHLPERTPLQSPSTPSTPTAPTLCLVRRIYRSPRLLPDPPGRCAREAVRGRPLEALAPRRLWGPFVLSGHWWEWEVSREYYYAEDAAGVLLWLYRDRHTRRFWIAGTVE